MVLALLAAPAPLLAQAMVPGGEAVPEGPVTEPVEQSRPNHDEELAILLDRLSDPDAPAPERIEQRVIELWSDSGSDTANLLLRRGQDALNAEDYEAAIEHFSALIDHEPGFAEAWNARATTFFMMDLPGLSVPDIEQALTLNPQHFGALAGLGIILEQTGEAKGALAAFRAAQALNPHRDQVNEAVDRLATEVDGPDI
ncbi:tetratricopeptide repeat protein [Oceanicella sp. SM1341]|uniref:tetratricopeptide repeat protein n=1 Tax=Oceanicella sp. SM1341 TaxID=1548889 RepID=UPI001E40170F|nr:tetratricopeptide repeat protein [Oceanicella sp. SM1341]